MPRTSRAGRVRFRRLDTARLRHPTRYSARVARTSRGGATRTQPNHLGGHGSTLDKSVTVTMASPNGCTFLSIFAPIVGNGPSTYRGVSSGTRP